MKSKLDKLKATRNKWIKTCNFLGKASLIALGASLVLLGLGKLGSKRVTKLQDKIYGLEDEKFNKLNVESYETERKTA